MPLRPALGGGGGAAAWESVAGFFQADAAEVIQAGDCFMFLSREANLGGNPAFIFDTTEEITQDLLHIYNNIALRLTVEADGNLIPGQGTTWGGFDVGDPTTTLGMYRGNVNALWFKGDYLMFSALAAAGYMIFNVDSKDYMKLDEHKLVLGYDPDERGWLFLNRMTTGGNKCGMIEFKDELNVSGYLWKDQLHNLRFHTVLPGVDDTVGAGVRLNIFGMLFTSNGVGTQTLTVAGSNYKISQMDSATVPKGGMSLDAANNKIVVPVNGDYRISFQVSFTGSLAGIYKLWIVKAAAGLDGTRVRTKVLNNGDHVSVAMSSFRGLAAGNDLEIWVSCDQAGAVFVVKDLQFTVDLMERT